VPIDDRLRVRDDADVPSATISAYEATRRDLVRRGIAAGGATVLASTIPTLTRVRDAFAAAAGDGAVLADALAIEQVVVFAYDRVLASGALSAPAARAARSFQAHERRHVQALTVEVHDHAGTAPRAPASPTDVDRALGGFGVKRSLGMLHTHTEHLSFLIELEAVATGAYYDVVARLKDFRLLQLAAQIMANEAQHATVLRALAHPRDIGRAVPAAFEQGKRRRR
jgi:hypothetical protein